MIKKSNIRVQVTIPKYCYEELKRANINISKHLSYILVNYTAVETNLVINDLKKRWKK